jgi:NitT/TauT family transport system substrate-binding protein
MKLLLAVMLCLLMGAATSPAGAAEKVSMGIVGGFNAFTWPAAVAVSKGLYAQRGIEADVIFMPSSPGMLQQLAAGSLDIAGSAGLVDPVRLVARGAPIALGRVELRVSPYVLVGKPQFHAIADLKGKNVAIGSRNNITWILIVKMLAAAGLKPSDVEMFYSGSTVSRYAALKTGAFDATFLAPPASFIAEDEGFRDLGIAGDYTKDLPFTGSVVNRNWAKAHMTAAKNFFAANDAAVDWLHDPAHRAEAIKILVEKSKSNEADAARSYDFFVGGHYFDDTHKVSRRGVAALVAALHALGDNDVNPTPEQTVIAGVTGLRD